MGIEDAEQTAATQETEAIAIRDWTGKLVLSTPEQFVLADKALGRMHTKKKEWKVESEKITKPAYATWKNAVAFFNRGFQVLDEAIDHTKKLMKDFRDEERKKREAEERRQQKILDDERNKEQEKLRKAEEKAREKGEEGYARELAEKQEVLKFTPTPLVVLPNEVPKTEQTTTRTEWKFRIKTPEAVPHEWRTCEPNVKAIRAYAKNMKDNAKIAGVEFWSEEEPVLLGSKKS